jgi:hypothetical protein
VALEDAADVEGTRNPAGRLHRVSKEWNTLAGVRDPVGRQ